MFNLHVRSENHPVCELKQTVLNKALRTGIWLSVIHIDQQMIIIEISTKSGRFSSNSLMTFSWNISISWQLEALSLNI